MKSAEKMEMQATAVEAAKAAGAIMSRNHFAAKKINESTQRDIKLELDVKCQQKIESMLTRAHPEVAILGEEGNAGDIETDLRWIVDPIDGTVNYTYGIPHACVSIALQQRLAKRIANAGHGGHHNIAAQIQTAPGQVRLPRLSKVGEQQHTHSMYFACKHRHVVVGLG